MHDREIYNYHIFDKSKKKYFDVEIFFFQAKIFKKKYNKEFWS